MGCGSITTSKTHSNSTKFYSASSLHRRSLSGTETLSQFYTIVKEIGTGSFSKVYLARENQTNHLRALKVVSKEMVKAHQLTRNGKFLEGEILKELDHPNIVKCFEVFENDGSFCLSQEYISGCNLREYLHTNKEPLSEEIMASIMKQLLQSLCYCHNRGIIHRDIKPDNILITSNPKLQLKLGDFGCASLKKDLDDEIIAGTVTYMAPEVFEGKINEKVDIWACGVILYIILARCSPYKGKDREGFISQINLNPISSKRPELQGCPDEILNFLDKLLKRKPSKRYSAQEALNDPWLVKMQKKYRLSQVLMDQIASTSSKSWIQKAFIIFYNKMFSESEEFRKITKLFSIIDSNNNGFIEKSELVKYLKESFSKEKANQIARRFFKDYDLNANNFIDYSEFVCSFGNFDCKINRINIEKVFHVIDFKKDAFVTVGQINDAFQVDLTKDIQRRFKDRKQEQKIDLNEFVDFIMNN